MYTQVISSIHAILQLAAICHGHAFSAIGRRTQPEAKNLEFAKLDITIAAKKVFRFAFNPNLFLWPEGNYGGLDRPHYRYTPFLKDQADMPEWMEYKYSQRHKAGKAIAEIITMILLLAKIMLLM